MPRNRGGGRPAPKPFQRSKSAPPPASFQSAPPPARYEAPPSFLGGLAGAIAQGAAFGTGSAIAHRTVDAIAGPRSVHHEHTTATSQPPQQPGNMRSMDDSCINVAKAFQDCVNANVQDIGKCQFYLDMLNECRKNNPAGSGPSGPPQQ